jgi:tRNA threonylcarbamoyladenosine biosynthesis protein TsaB
MSELGGMNVLALDLSFPEGVVTLSFRGKVFWRMVEGSRRAADLFPLVSDILSEAGADRGSIEALGVGRGPGAFTGVRVAVTAAKFLAWAWDLLLVAPSSLETIAFSLREEGLVCPCMDARRKEFYFGLYRREGDSLRVVEGPLLGSVETLREKLLDWYETYREDIALAGNAGQDVVGGLPLGEPLYMDGPSPEGLLGAVIAHLREKGLVRPMELLPLYLRRPDAEEKQCCRGA